MTKTTTTKKPTAKKKPGGIAKLAPKPAAAPAPKATAEAAAAPAVRAGPRGGKPATRPDRAVALSFKVSQAQYRLLIEARLDANVTVQELLQRAVAYFFEHELGTKF